MKNKITIKKRTYNNTYNSANFEFSDSRGYGCVLQVNEIENKTIIRVMSKDKQIKVVVEKSR